MPPRAIKKNAGTPTLKKSGAKTPVKTPKSVTKTPPPKAEAENDENQTPVAEQEVKSVHNAEDVKPAVKPEEEKPQETPSAEDAKDNGEEDTKNTVSNGSAAQKEAEEDVKPPFDEDDKGERLDLDDNEPESEPEDDDNIEEGSKDDPSKMDLDKEIDQEGLEQDEEEEDLEEQLDEGEEGQDEGEDEEGIGEEDEEVEGEEIEGEGEDEEEGEEPEDGIEGDEEEHHAVVKERRKRKEFEVFVGGLDKDAVEEDLRKVFGEVGEVVEVRLMMNNQTQKNKGFAFIRYATVDQAKRAVTELKNPQVKGKICGVSPSQDNDTIFLGNICKTWTKEALREKLKYYGIENIEDLMLVEDTQNEGMNRGFAFLEFSARADAMNAFKRLQKRDVVFGTDRTAKVSFAETFTEPDEEVMAQVKTVFVDGLAASWDEDRVKENFKKYGEIEKIQLARNMPSARRKDFGFVTYTTHDAAVACIEGLNNTELGDGDNKVKVKARLSKPHQKGRLLKRGVRGGYRIGRGGTRGGRAPWGRGSGYFEARRFIGRGGRFIGRGGQLGGRGIKRPFGFREGRRLLPPIPDRVAGRQLPPLDRARERRIPAASYPRSGSRREYDRRDEPYVDRPSRSSSRSAPDFATRAAAARRAPYRDNYGSRGSSYSDAVPRGVSRSASRRPPYPEESYGRRIDRAYRDTRGRDYDSVSGSKRSYSAMDDAPRYPDSAVRHSRARLDYGVSAGASQYGDAPYGESSRVGRGSQLGYGGGARGSIAAGQDSYGLYDGHQSGMGYSGGSLAGSEAGGIYSSSYGSDYMSSGADIGGGSYSSLYSNRSLGSNYLPGSGSGSYY